MSSWDTNPRLKKKAHVVYLFHSNNHLRLMITCALSSIECIFIFLQVLEARDLPVKDLSGSSDPYVKIYLLPSECKRKYQTRVHRKNLNPIFNETFVFRYVWLLCNGMQSIMIFSNWYYCTLEFTWHYLNLSIILH